MKSNIILSGLFLTATASAGMRSSGDYAITTDILDSGGQSASSGDYGNQGSVAPVNGVSDQTSPVPCVVRHGYIGQLYDLSGYGLLASDYYPPEEGSTQLIPVRTADDGTNVVIPTSGFSFVPLEGPIPDISPDGLVETASIYENTDAIVGALSPQFAGLITLTLHVQDTIPDNYGTYAHDGLPDAWQRQYFGLENPLAAPGLDPDGDGQSNDFEFTAGIVPTDPLSRFQLRIESVPGQADRKDLIFSPLVEGRIYRVLANTGLAAPWLPLEAGTFTTSDLGIQRTVSDREATPPRRFYQVEISKP